MQQDNEITYEDVKGWKATQPFGQKAKPYGTNSYVADEPYQEYQCDLFFWPKPRTSEKQHKRAVWKDDKRIWSTVETLMLYLWLIFLQNTHKLFH